MSVDEKKVPTVAGEWITPREASKRFHKTIRENLDWRPGTEKLMADESVEVDPPLEVPYIQWVGDPADAMPPASALLAEHTGALSGINEALAFYAGDQWPVEVRAEREAHARPVLTVNRLPLLVAAAIAADPTWSLMPCEVYSAEYEASLTRLKVIITQRNMDAQKFYNYMVSNVAEMAAVPRCDRLHASDILLSSPLAEVDTIGCRKCGTTRQVRRKVQFNAPSLPGDDPGCPKCGCGKTAEP